MITQPDASGGLGSFSGTLLGELVGGLKLVAAGELSRRYGYSFGADGQIAVNADGSILPSAAPSQSASIGDQLANSLSNPLVIAAGVAAVVVVIALVARN